MTRVEGDGRTHVNTGNAKQSGRRIAFRGWSVGLACAVVLIPFTAPAQQPDWRATVGAYYFDGWTGQNG